MRLDEPNNATRRATAGPSAGSSRALDAPLAASGLHPGTGGVGGRRNDEFWFRCGRRLALRALPKSLAIERPQLCLWGLDPVLAALACGASHVVVSARRLAAGLGALASDLQAQVAMARDLGGSIR